MRQEIVDNLLAVVADAETIRNAASNRDDPRIRSWREKAREAVARLAPAKLPAFDEIPFASDYFLSRPETERRRIDDRIALVSDFDAAVKILRDIAERVRRAGVAGDSNNPSSPVAARDGRWERNGAPGLAEVRGLAANMGFPPRDLEEALAALDQAEAGIAAAPPDWDRVKRAVKFLMDFDRALALAAVPAIFSLYARKTGL
jgi:hypothetical protein